MTTTIGKMPDLDWREVRTPGGERKRMPVNRTLACSVCVRAAGIDPAKPPKDFTTEPFAMTRTGNRITCPRCAHYVEIISDAELAAERQAERDAENQQRILTNPHCAEAARTGKPVLIRTYMDECRGDWRMRQECSTDAISVMAMPDGSITEKVTHTY